MVNCIAHVALTSDFPVGCDVLLAKGWPVHYRTWFGVHFSEYWRRVPHRNNPSIYHYWSQAQNEVYLINLLYFRIFSNILFIADTIIHVVLATRSWA